MKLIAMCQNNDYKYAYKIQKDKKIKTKSKILKFNLWLFKRRSMIESGNQISQTFEFYSFFVFFGCLILKLIY